MLSIQISSASCRFSVDLSPSHLFGAAVSLLIYVARRVDTGDVAGWQPLDIEAHYVSADRGAVSTTLGAVDSLRLVHGLPVRDIPSHAGQRHYPGLFWSATTRGHVWYESLLELDRLWLADFDPEVEWIASQPVWLVGLDGTTRRRHVPDLFLRSPRGDTRWWMSSRRSSRQSRKWRRSSTGPADPHRRGANQGQPHQEGSHLLPRARPNRLHRPRDG